MSPEDIAEVKALGETTAELATGTTTPNFYGSETLARWTRSEYGASFIARDESRPFYNSLAGFVLAQVLPASRDAYINALAVQPGYRRQGVATALFGVAEAKLAELGANHLFLVTKVTDLAMLELAEKNGFQLGDPMRYLDKMLKKPSTKK